MQHYTPDSWVIVRISSKHGTVDKVLAGWTGSYLYGDSWKLNSGITHIAEDASGYEVCGHSGSVYFCRKHGEGLSGITSSVLESFKKQLEGEGTIEVIPISSIVKDYATI